MRHGPAVEHGRGQPAVQRHNSAYLMGVNRPAHCIGAGLRCDSFLEPARNRTSYPRKQGTLPPDRITWMFFLHGCTKRQFIVGHLR